MGARQKRRAPQQATCWLAPWQTRSNPPTSTHGRRPTPVLGQLLQRVGPELRLLVSFRERKLACATKPGRRNSTLAAQAYRSKYGAPLNRGQRRSWVAFLRADERAAHQRSSGVRAILLRGGATPTQSALMSSKNERARLLSAVCSCSWREPKPPIAGYLHGLETEKNGALCQMA